jgi:hypothetical protein
MGALGYRATAAHETRKVSHAELPACVASGERPLNRCSDLSLGQGARRGGVPAMSSGRERGERGGLEARGKQAMAVVHVAMRL